MCTGCKELRGKALDVYAAALQRPAVERMKFIEAQDRNGTLGLVSLLGPMIAEHVHD